MSRTVLNGFFGFALVSFLSAPICFAVPAVGRQIMIAGPNDYAVQAGKNVARLGGNVIDVAVAVELVLSVTSPYFASLGGGGFALVKMNGAVEALDFRETAPSRTHAEFYAQRQPGESETGGAAVAVPGVPAGLWALHKKYGKLHWSQLFSDAIRLAERGFEVSGQWYSYTNEEIDRLNSKAKSLFTKNGKALLPGELLIQKSLASGLKEIRTRGIAPFYEGMMARDIVASVRKAGGVMEFKDLKDYKVRWLKPLTTSFAGFQIHLMPPPSSGGVVIASALKLAEGVQLPSKPAGSVEEFHLIAEVLNRSFRGRVLLGDPDFHENPINLLTSTTYLQKMATSIKSAKAQHLKPLVLADLQKESTETTHFSIMDNAGNAVTFTVTVNGNWGSGIVTEQYGINLNNEMDDFTTLPNKPNQFGLIQGPANNVEPGKRPLSSMSPTIVERDGKTELVLGSPGGPRIISAVFQVLYRALATRLDIDKAIQFPRVHNQFLPESTYVDPDRLAPEILAGLKSKGHKIEDGAVGKVYGVMRTKENWLEGAFDARGEGLAQGF